MFNIFKDYLVTTHLNSQKMVSIYNYLEHYGLFNLVRNGCINQTVIWREVYISSDSAKNTISSSSRHFLIIIGLVNLSYLVNCSANQN